MTKNLFLGTGLPEVLGGYLGATVQFLESDSTVGKPEVSTF